MKKYSLMAFLLLIIPLSTFGQSTDTGRDVIDLCKGKFRWMINHRFDSLESILDDRLRFIHSNGWIQTKDEFLADLKSGKLNYQNIEIKESDVRVYETAAIVIGKGKFSGILSTAPFSTDLMFTEVYVLRDKVWQLASRHANKIQ